MTRTRDSRGAKKHTYALIALIIVTAIAAALIIAWAATGTPHDKENEETGGVAAPSATASAMPKATEEQISACKKAMEEAASAQSAFTETVHGDAVQSALTVGETEVADGATVAALEAAVSPVVARPVECPETLDAVAAEQVTAAWKGVAAAYRRGVDGVNGAVAAVIASRDARTLEDAQATLAGQLADGQVLLVSSQGNVADDTTRQALTVAIQAGQAAQDSSDAAVVRAAANGIYAASVSVNQSVQDKQKADAAARVAARKAVEQPASSQTGQGQGEQERGSSAQPTVSPSAVPLSEGMPDGSQVTMIGDSIMKGASAALQARFPGVYVDASVSRQFTAASSCVESARGSGNLRQWVVVGLGTNGTIRRSDLEALDSQLGEGHVLVLTTVYVRSGRSWIVPNNQLIAQYAAEHADHVVVADWAAAISAQPDLLVSDGFHPREPAGGNLYAQTIWDAMNAWLASRGG